MRINLRQARNALCVMLLAALVGVVGQAQAPTPADVSVFLPTQEEAQAMLGDGWLILSVESFSDFGAVGTYVNPEQGKTVFVNILAFSATEAASAEMEYIISYLRKSDDVVFEPIHTDKIGETKWRVACGLFPSGDYGAICLGSHGGLLIADYGRSLGEEGNAAIPETYALFWGTLLKATRILGASR